MPRRVLTAACVAFSVTTLAGCASSAAKAGPSSHPMVTRPAGSPTAAGPTATAAPSTARPRTERLGWALPQPLSREVVLALDGSLLVVGGRTAAQTSTAEVYAIDPATGRATPRGRLAQAVHDASGAVLGAAAYLFGGGAASTVPSVQRVGNGTATVVGSLPQPRSDLVAVAAGGRAVVLGGYDGSTTTPTVLSTRDGRSWRTVARLPLGVRYAAVAAVGDAVFLLGGEHGGAPIDAIQRVDLAAGTARVIGHLPAPLAHACAGSIGGRIVVAGGRSGGVTVDRVLVLDAAGRVLATGRLPRAVADAGCAVSGGALWLLGGETPSTVSTVQRVTLPSG